MTITTKKYYCDESLKKTDKDKIEYLLTYAFGLADQVEFNVLYKDDKLLNETIKNVKDDIVASGQRFDKIYNGVEFIRFSLTDKVKDFIRTKGIMGWRNTQLEDISFLRDNVEFLGTVSHENYIILQMTDKERESLNDMGFNFEFDYGTDAREIKEA